MDTLKKLFPLSFKRTDSVGNLIVGILIYLVVGIIGGVAIGILAHIPVVNWVVGIVGALLDLYCVVGIVLQILAFCKVLK